MPPVPSTFRYTLVRLRSPRVILAPLLGGAFLTAGIDTSTRVFCPVTESPLFWTVRPTR